MLAEILVVYIVKIKVDLRKQLFGRLTALQSTVVIVVPVLFKPAGTVDVDVKTIILSQRFIADTLRELDPQIKRMSPVFSTVTILLTVSPGMTIIPSSGKSSPDAVFS